MLFKDQFDLSKATCSFNYRFRCGCDTHGNDHEDSFGPSSGGVFLMLKNTYDRCPCIFRPKNDLNLVPWSTLFPTIFTLRERSTSYCSTYPVEYVGLIPAEGGV